MYRMIWNETESPAVIVMLTQTHEQGREKCFQYYPKTLASPTLHVFNACVAALIATGPPSQMVVAISTACSSTKPLATPGPF